MKDMKISDSVKFVGVNDHKTANTLKTATHSQ